MFRTVSLPFLIVDRRVDWEELLILPIWLAWVSSCCVEKGDVGIEVFPKGV